jgi:hypothetical protein
MSPQDWQSKRGTVIRIAFHAEHTGHGELTLPCEIDIEARTDPVTVYVP